ncbi:neuropilin and tolloid-like protein 1 [Lytechinus variegatus]|uniref:neuropilin and tolloid-like protein 1 n=2 Tax=Lytechinus variegatus TaxID=7654 RepID=UPI001BB198A9|nr:neuropilin and tolloid-like protein 1 [Lytechinus variegatus]
MFASPNYPLDYNSDEECVYRFEAAENEVIELVFSSTFNVEGSAGCEYDYIEIHDGRYGYSPLITRDCGNVAPPRIVSSGNHLLMFFITDSLLVEQGFAGIFRYLPAPTKPQATSVSTKRTYGPEECFFSMDGYDGEISAQDVFRILDEDKRWPTKIDCTWEVTVPPNNKIMIEFAEFSLHYVNECYMNQIMIYDKYAWDLKRMKTFCSTSAPSIMTTSNRAYIRFQANTGSVKNFWKVIYTAYRDYECNETASFTCGEYMCINRELVCNGRQNCYNMAYDEADCEPEHPTSLLNGKIDAVLGCMMAIIFLVTFITICLTCRHSWLRTRERAKAMSTRRKAEKQAVQYMMDNEANADAQELSPMGERETTNYTVWNKNSFTDENYVSCNNTSSSTSRHLGAGRASLTSQVSDYVEHMMDRIGSVHGQSSGGSSEGKLTRANTNNVWTRQSFSDHPRTVHKYPTKDIQVHV